MVGKRRVELCDFFQNPIFAHLFVRFIIENLESNAEVVKRQSSAQTTTPEIAEIDIGKLGDVLLLSLHHDIATVFRKHCRLGYVEVGHTKSNRHFRV